MDYWIYHDKVTRSAKLHYATCGACNQGRGMHGHQNRLQNEWYGLYTTKADAQYDAEKRKIGVELKPCGICKP